MPNLDFDVVVIGGGPAGSSMGCYLARAGLNCAVFEKELFPRPHVGESLVPSSTRVFKDLDFLDQMDEAGFPRKYGAVWTSDGSQRLYDHDWEGLHAECHADIRFEEREQPGVDRNFTYHVDRGKFDLMLLKHAQKLGATVYTGVRVADIDFSANEHVSVQVVMGRQKVNLKTRMVVDASGRNTFLGVRLKLKRRDPVFDQYAIHTWFDGYDRSVVARTSGQDNYIFIHFLPITNSWLWQIPITETITSVGVVTQKKHFAKSKESREQFFWECMSSRPELYQALKKSRQMRPFTDEGDYSYAMDDICGDRFVMIGDAARFVDPIFSTGVSIALNSARFASKDILRAFETGDFSKKAFEDFQATIRRGTKNWHEFITVYYRLNVLFTAFIMDPRYRIDVLKLLQGDVYDEDEPEVLTKMRQLVTDVERNENNPLHKLLGSLTANEFSPTF